MAQNGYYVSPSRYLETLYSIGESNPLLEVIVPAKLHSLSAKLRIPMRNYINTDVKVCHICTLSWHLQQWPRTIHEVAVSYWLLGLNLFLAYQIAEDYLLSLGFML